MTAKTYSTMTDGQRIYIDKENNKYLTGRESECLSLLSKGMNYFDVAAELQLSERTVKKHVKSMKTKFDVNNLFQLGCAYTKLMN